MPWFVLSCALTLSWIPNQTSFGGVGSPTQNVLAQTLEINAEILSHLRVATELETRDQALSALGYAPFQSRYRIRAELYTPSFAIGIKHECIHPTLSGSKVLNDLNTDETEIFLKISSKR